MRSMGLGGALVVLVSVLAALTLLPALLGLLGPKVNSLRVIGRKNGDELFWGQDRLEFLERALARDR